MTNAQLGTALGSIGAVGTAVSGIWAMGKAATAQGQIEQFQQQITDLENARPPITNPYDNITDLSSTLKNEYENIGVATQAAKFQAEEADIALANTLDTLRSTGAGAGGATALAQAALKSKRNISASLEQQEVANEKLRAQGAMQLQQAKMAEKQRVQQAQVAGEQFVYSEEDKRVMQQLDRTQAMLDQERTNEIAYQTQAMNAFGSTASSLGSLGGSLITGKNADAKVGSGG